MRRLNVFPLALSGGLFLGIHPVSAQTNGPIVPSGSHVAVSHAARPGVAHSAAPASQNFGHASIAVAPQPIYSHLAGIPNYSTLGPRRYYSPYVRSLNPSLAAMYARQTASIYHTQHTASLLARNNLGRNPTFENQLSGDRDSAGQPTAAVLARRQLRQENLATNPSVLQDQKPTTIQQVSPNALAPREVAHRVARPNWKDKDDTLSFSDARRCHWHEWHNRDWWCQHFRTIVLVGGGYYFWDAGYWYPAWGYDPLNSNYDYDGPIYTYGNLLPDEVISNVQATLQDAGYYFGAVTGSLDDETRAALANFQRDYGLPITGAIDEPTVETLGLDQSGVYQSGDVSNSSY